MDDTLLIVFACLVIAYVAFGQKAPAAAAPKKEGYVSAVARRQFSREKAAQRAGAKVSQETASLGADAVGAKNSRKGKEGYTTGEILNTLYGIEADATGNYTGGFGDPSDCSQIDTNSKHIVGSGQYRDYIHTGDLAYGPDVVRNHQTWVDEVAPWSQTASAAVDDLTDDEMRASHFVGISAWTRPGPTVSANATFQTEQDQKELNRSVNQARGVIQNQNDDDKTMLDM